MTKGQHFLSSHSLTNPYQSSSSSLFYSAFSSFFPLLKTEQLLHFSWEHLLTYCSFLCSPSLLIWTSQTTHLLFGIVRRCYKTILPLLTPNLWDLTLICPLAHSETLSIISYLCIPHSWLFCTILHKLTLQALFPTYSRYLSLKTVLLEFLQNSPSSLPGTFNCTIFPSKICFLSQVIPNLDWSKYIKFRLLFLYCLLVYFRTFSKFPY